MDVIEFYDTSGVQCSKMDVIEFPDTSGVQLNMIEWSAVKWTLLSFLIQVECS